LFCAHANIETTSDRHLPRRQPPARRPQRLPVIGSPRPTRKFAPTS